MFNYRLNDKSAKSISKRVSDCATPIQLRQLLEKFKDCPMCTIVQAVVNDRLAFLAEKCAYDPLQVLAIEDCEDIIADCKKIELDYQESLRTETDFRRRRILMSMKDSVEHLKEINKDDDFSIKATAKVNKYDKRS